MIDPSNTPSSNVKSRAAGVLRREASTISGGDVLYGGLSSGDLLGSMSRGVQFHIG